MQARLDPWVGEVVESSIHHRRVSSAPEGEKVDPGMVLDVEVVGRYVRQAAGWRVDSQEDSRWGSRWTVTMDILGRFPRRWAGGTSRVVAWTGAGAVWRRQRCDGEVNGLVNGRWRQKRGCGCGCGSGLVPNATSCNGSVK